jgi:hypothetical protein
MTLFINDLFESPGEVLDHLLHDIYEGLRRWFKRGLDGTFMLSSDNSATILRSFWKFNWRNDHLDELFELVIRYEEQHGDIKKFVWTAMKFGFSYDQIAYHTKNRVGVPSLSESEIEVLNRYEKIMSR